jgi:hypothetical protein
MPKIAKTNIGTKIHSQDEHLRQGSPNIRTKRKTLATIRDIYYPGLSENQSELINGQGIMVQLDFAEPYNNWWKNESDPLKQVRLKDYWFTLVEPYEVCLATLGNRACVKGAGKRVFYEFYPTSFLKGEAKLICDNTEEYTGYQINQTNNFIGTFMLIGTSTRCPGFP